MRRPSRLAPAPALAVAFYRNTIASGVLLSLARARQGQLRRVAPLSRLGLVVAGVLLALHFAAWIPSVSLTTV